MGGVGLLSSQKDCHRAKEGPPGRTDWMGVSGVKETQKVPMFFQEE